MADPNVAPQRPIPNDETVGMYLHCGRCLVEIMAGGVNESPRDYARLSVGWTPIGLQVWCVRHDCNVVHIDFQGQQHPANLTAKGESTQ